MADLEKVVKGLEVCTADIPVENGIHRDDLCQKCPYHNEKYAYCFEKNKLMQDALVLLKEQSAHILTIGQLEDALDTVVWLETPGQENLADGYSLIMAYSHKYGCMFFDSPFGDNPSQDRLEYSQYGRSWRCWDKRPSEEQKMAVKWE